MFKKKIFFVLVLLGNAPTASPAMNRHIKSHLPISVYSLEPLNYPVALVCILLVSSIVWFFNYNDYRQISLHGVGIDRKQNSVFITHHSQHLGGMGDRLFRYWMGRSCSYWNNMEFELLQDTSGVISYIDSHIFHQYQDKQDVLSYLPQQVGSYAYPMNHTIKKLLMKHHIDFSCKGAGAHFFHDKKEAFLFLNKFFVKIIQQETDAAITNYFHHASLPIITHNFKPCDITVHIRCGDEIVLVKVDSFFRYSYYKYAIKTLLFHTKNEHCLSHKTDYLPKTLRIVTQINSKGAHLQEEHDSAVLQSCNALIAEMANKFDQDFPHEIKVINNDLVNDYKLLVDSPILVCGKSGFCRNAALANRYQKVAFYENNVWFDEMEDILPDENVVIPEMDGAWILTGCRNSLNELKRNRNLLFDCILGNNKSQAL